MWVPSPLHVRLSEAQNNRCCYCTVEMTFDRWQDTSLTKEHVVPKAFGGTDSWYNLVAACRKCNRLRDTMDAYRFYRLMSQGKMKKLIREARFKSVYFKERAIKKAKESKEGAWAFVKRMRRLATET